MAPPIRQRSDIGPCGWFSITRTSTRYIDWFNHRRLLGEITADNAYVTPAEFEAAYYRQATPVEEAVTL